MKRDLWAEIVLNEWRPRICVTGEMRVLRPMKPEPRVLNTLDILFSLICPAQDLLTDREFIRLLSSMTLYRFAEVKISAC
ncbi:MAG TPA: hypothetical protein VNL13_07810 [Sulfolobales archaeon]|nr:hypothetical protein [Sulfolobales archaeon]